MCGSEKKDVGVGFGNGLKYVLVSTVCVWEGASMIGKGVREQMGLCEREGCAPKLKCTSRTSAIPKALEKLWGAHSSPPEGNHCQRRRGARSVGLVDKYSGTIFVIPWELISTGLD